MIQLIQIGAKGFRINVTSIRVLAELTVVIPPFGLEDCINVDV